PADGWHLFVETEYKHPRPAIRMLVRHAIFSIDHYDLRVYSRESDALWAYSMVMLYGKGTRTSFLLQYKNRKNFNLWFKGGMTRVIRPAAHNAWVKQLDLSVQINITF
ncbi:MAG: hypothetical protein R6V49_07980, partial [Bacteroidales bacterium]